LISYANSTNNYLRDVEKLIIKVDDTNRVKESNEKNNIEVIDVPKEVEIDYHPGEVEKYTSSSARAKQWNIEIPSGTGEYDENLGRKAYKNLFRAPYIQNVTPNSAVVAYRTLCTKKDAYSTVKLYEVNTDRLIHTYRTSSSNNLNIITDNVTDNYVYDSDTFWSDHTGNDDRLNKKGSGQYRPNLEYRVTFKNLQPNTTYYYHIEAKGEDENSNLIIHTLANKVMFKTAPSYDSKKIIKFIAMGDFGQADDKPSYFYDVFDLMHSVVRHNGTDFWLALGDLDNCTDGHPNAIDPFFFSVYNAYMDEVSKKSSSLKFAESTTVKAFRSPPYYGILGGMPVYPTFGNHDIRYTKYANYDTADKYPSWEKFYKSSFIFPTEEDSWNDAASTFNTAGDSFFYTYRYDNAIFISLAAPSSTNSYTQEVYDKLNAQYVELEIYLNSIQSILDRDDIWLIIFTHDHKLLYNNYTYSHIDLKNHSNFFWQHNTYDFNKLFLKYNVNIVLSGHEHFYDERRYECKEKDNQNKCLKNDDNYLTWNKNNPEKFDLFHIISGTGGYGDDEGAVTKEPGFVSFEIKGNKLKYVKYDTHICYTEELARKIVHNKVPQEFEQQIIKKLTDQPIGGRDGINPHIAKYGELSQENGKLRFIKNQSQTFTKQNAYLPPKIIKYTIKVETGDIINAGTDAAVSIKLYGTKGESTFIQLDSKRDNFENSDKDNFNIMHEDIGNITTITIKHDNSGNKADWFLEKVIIVQNNSIYNFTAQQWLSHSSRSVEPTITIKEDATRVKYNVAVRTSNNHKDAGTNAGVYIQLFGNNGKSTPLQRIDDKSVNDFEKGSLGQYTVYADENLGEVNKIKLEHDNTKDGPGWKIDEIVVNNLYTFSIDAWLKSDNRNEHPSKIFTR